MNRVGGAFIENDLENLKCTYFELILLWFGFSETQLTL